MLGRGERFEDAPGALPHLVPTPVSQVGQRDAEGVLNRFRPQPAAVGSLDRLEELDRALRVASGERQFEEPSRRVACPVELPDEPGSATEPAAEASALESPAPEIDSLLLTNGDWQLAANH